MWGIVPAAGIGSRIQPLAFSKELLPVGSRLDNGVERPCAVSEYLVERMIHGGADKICFVISPGKSDIMEYYGASYGNASIAYVVQPEPRGLCDAIFRAAPLIPPDESAIVGLPDTVWFPEKALTELPENILSFLLFPVEHPQWIWGAFKMPGHVLEALRRLWRERNGEDEYIGTLVNAYLAQGGEAIGVKAGESYVDVGTLHGYRSAIGLLSEAAQHDDIAGARVALGWPAGRMPRGLHDLSRE
jgi:dTDP-glucose pyrophosphorylase